MAGSGAPSSRCFGFKSAVFGCQGQAADNRERLSALRSIVGASLLANRASPGSASELR
ncbi:hypothetical protein PCLA_03r0007 [Pseudomonas citronellolis]|nr:hypothetical protein PCLA_03r0007 [Pseudomonas citronellolis]